MQQSNRRLSRIYDSLLLVLLPSSVLLRSHILLLLVISLRGVCGEAPGGIFGPLATRRSSVLTSHHLLELLGRDGVRVLDWLTARVVLELMAVATAGAERLRAIWLVLAWVAMVRAVLVRRRGAAGAHVWDVLLLAVWHLVGAGTVMRTPLALLVLLARAVALGVLMLVLLGPAVVWNMRDIGKVLVVLRWLVLTNLAAICSLLLTSCVSKSLTVMRLTSWLRLRHVSRLVLAPNEGVLSQRGWLTDWFWLLMEALRQFSLLNLRKCLIMVVTLKQLLDAWSLKLGLVDFHLLRVGVFPLAVGVLSVEVILFSRR